MPLLDHFHPPLSERRPWESFHATWCSALADYLNREILPPEFIALEQVHPGTAVEIDVGAFAEEGVSSGRETGNGTTTIARTIWTPTTAPLVLPAAFPERFAVEIHSTEGGRTLVAAVELVSPGNKDRDTKRRLFAAKCATYLARGAGLVVVDVVTSRRANMHNELARLLDLEPGLWMADASSLYAAAYRPLRRQEKELIEAWPMPLAVGQALPTVPLSLAADFCPAVALEESYRDACQRRRVDEALG